MSFSHDTIERVKDAADIVEVVSAHTDLRRAGERYTGLCPFHEERSPSFSVDAREKLYYCFGCQAGGDVFRFVEEKEGLAFPEAVEALAERYGVEAKREREDPEAEARRARRERLSELLDRTGAFYVTSLWESDEAAKARAYLLERGLGEEALREFGVGYAPSAWDTVLKRGQMAGFSVDEMAAAGLVQRSQKGERSFYDCFRARIMFPIRDPKGRMQGFGGRASRSDQMPKYKNSPEGELFRKSTLLYAIDLARPAIAKSGRAVVVEGYTDVIAAHQAGVKETVAVMGTAITPEQVQRLSAHSEEVVLALDADSAGRKAMLRAQRVAKDKRVRLRVAAMTAGEDPADMLTGEGAEEAAVRFRGLIDEAVDLPVFHVRTMLDEADTATPNGRDRALDEALPVIAAMGDSITRDELLREVAERLSADPGLVGRRLEEVKAGKGPRNARAPAPPAGSPMPAGNGEDAKRPVRMLSAWERRERTLLAMCVDKPELGKRYLEQLTADHLSSEVTERARAWIAAHPDAPADALPREDEALGTAVREIVMRAGVEPTSEESMRGNFLLLDQGLVERKIDAAKQSGEAPPVELLRRRNELAEQIAGRNVATA